MIINFVCRQNAYRSRLAEAYLNSLKLPGIRAISTGYEAEKSEDGPISWVAARILKRRSLLPFMSDKWRQLTQEDIETSDFLVFMTNNVYENCVRRFKINGKKQEIWDIKDFEEYGITNEDNSLNDELKKIQLSDQAFEQIKDKVNGFVDRINKNPIISDR